jgi:hypothetical protein
MNHRIPLNCLLFELAIIRQADTIKGVNNTP